MAYLVTNEVTISDVASATLDVPIPAGYQENDLLLMFISQDGGATDITVNIAGWNLLSGSQSQNQAQRTVCYYKIAGASESDVVLSGSTDDWICSFTVIRNVNTTTPIHQYDITNSDNSTTPYLDSGTVTTTEDGCTILHCWGFDSVFKLAPLDPNTMVNVSREISLGNVQYVGYYNHNTAGLTSTIRMLSEVSSEGGTCITIAVSDADPSSPKMSPDCIRSYEVVKRYGGITTANNNVAAFIRHDNVTWLDQTHITATSIDGISVSTEVATLAEGSPTIASSPWGTFSQVTTTANGVDATGVWVGSCHTMSSYDFSSKIVYLEWSMSSVTSSRYGVKGTVLYLEDSSGGWSCYQLGTRSGIFVGVPYQTFISVDNDVPLGSSGTFDASDVVKVGYLYHRTSTSTVAFGIRVKNLLTLDRVTFVDGCAESPAKNIFADRVLNGHGANAVVSVQGNGQALLRNGFRVGNGTRKTYFDASATSHELPLSTNRFWRVPALAGGGRYRIFASANDTINLTSCIIATDSRQEFLIDTGSSASATYDFSGASIIKFDITNNEAGVTINGATLKNCGITLNGGGLDNCIIVEQPTHLITNDPSNISDCAFTSAGSGHAIEITATGTFDFSGNTFSGYGSGGTTDAAIYNNSGGAVTLTIPTGGQVPTILNGTGASTTISTPAAGYTLELPNIIDGSRYQIYNVTADTELHNAVVSGGSGISHFYTEGADFTAGDTGRYRVTYQSGTTAKQTLTGAFTFPSGTTTNSLPVTQSDQTEYNTFGLDGSTVTEFAWDSGNIQVDINDSDNTTTIQRLGAWYYYYITTATGIDEAFDAITWLALNSIRINTSNVNMTLDNTKASPLLLTGGRLYRSDGATIIASASNSIQIDYDPVYTVETGTSGLTAGESALLSNIADVKAKTDAISLTSGNVNANIKAVNDVALQGAGVEGNEWRPA